MHGGRTPEAITNRRTGAGSNDSGSLRFAHATRSVASVRSRSLLNPVNCACYFAPPRAPSGRVADSLAFLEAPEPAAHYFGVVNEDILIPVVGRDEAVALLYPGAVSSRACVVVT